MKFAAYTPFSTATARATALCLFAWMRMMTTTVVVADNTGDDSWLDHFLPNCIQEPTILDTAQCLYEFLGGPLCFDQDTPQDLADCFANEIIGTANGDGGGGGGDMETNRTRIVEELINLNSACLDPYRTCLVDAVQEAVDELPPCVRDTTVALGECVKDNALECGVQCAVDNAAVWDNPYDNIGYFFPTCRALERNLVQPACDVMACCTPCLTALEEAAECIVNDVLELGAWFVKCDFECEQNDSNNRRQLHHHETRDDESEQQDRRRPRRQLQDNINTTDIYNECATLTPGLQLTQSDGDNTIQDQFEAWRTVMARSNYFECLVEESLDAVDDFGGTYAPTAAPTIATATTAAPTTEEESASSSGADQMTPSWFFVLSVLIMATGTSWWVAFA